MGDGKATLHMRKVSFLVLYEQVFVTARPPRFWNDSGGRLGWLQRCPKGQGLVLCGRHVAQRAVQAILLG